MESLAFPGLHDSAREVNAGENWQHASAEHHISIVVGHVQRDHDYSRSESKNEEFSRCIVSLCGTDSQPDTRPLDLSARSSHSRRADVRGAAPRGPASNPSAQHEGHRRPRNNDTRDVLPYFRNPRKRRDILGGALKMSEMEERLSGPRGYKRAREEALAAGDSTYFVRAVEDRPYFPRLNVDPANQEESALNVAKVVVDHLSSKNDEGHANAGTLEYEGQISVISGGLTNALFKVDLRSPSLDDGGISVLVRIFGAEGLIDRDEENSTFARLCSESGGTESKLVTHEMLDLLGRFGNGRVETFIPNMRPAHYIRDFGRDEVHAEVARQLARIHSFDAPEYLTNGDAETKRPALWGVIADWVDDLSQQLTEERFQDTKLLELFSEAAGCASINSDDGDLSQIVKEHLLGEAMWLRNQVETRFPDAPVVFCHNDVNGGNILLDRTLDGKDAVYDKHSLAIIDYEYAAVNYALFDVGNFICEHCGGNDDATPKYNLRPNRKRVRRFLETYVAERDSLSGSRLICSSEQLDELCDQVELFEMASCLYWGVWGVLQSAGEVTGGSFNEDRSRDRMMGIIDTEEWDNLRYGRNRLARYFECKDKLLKSSR